MFGIGWKLPLSFPSCILTRFAAALYDLQINCWVMNVVPVSGFNTLPVLYDRGLIGVLHDWYVSRASPVDIQNTHKRNCFSLQITWFSCQFRGRGWLTFKIIYLFFPAYLLPCIPCVKFLLFSGVSHLILTQEPTTCCMQQGCCPLRRRGKWTLGYPTMKILYWYCYNCL